jgi:hypothetical protein
VKIKRLWFRDSDVLEKQIGSFFVILCYLGFCYVFLILRLGVLQFFFCLISPAIFPVFPPLDEGKTIDFTSPTSWITVVAVFWVSQIPFQVDMLVGEGFTEALPLMEHENPTSKPSNRSQSPISPSPFSCPFPMDDNFV